MKKKIMKSNNARHIIFYKHDVGTYVVVEPMAWARGNGRLFPQQRVPETSDEVCRFLEGKGFEPQKYDEYGVSVWINKNPYDTVEF